jgi:hypothetical protein
VYSDVLRQFLLEQFSLWFTAMGEAKRKKDATLNGPCPCGSAESARLCCFTGEGWKWHKKPAILGLKTLPPAGRVEKCYMKELGSCVAPISSEHIISKSVCQVLMGDGEFSISGVPWLEAGETKIIAPPQAKCLCSKHNSSLSPLDSAAYYFFKSFRSYLEHDNGMQHALLSGHDLERWLLKTAKAAAVSRNLSHGGKPLSGTFARDEAILDMLDDPQHWPEGAGLYCTMNTGDLTENSVRFQFQPFTNEEDDIEALAFNILGFRFMLMLDALDPAKYPFLSGAKFRPGRIQISYPNSTKWVTLCWDDNKVHEIITAQWLQHQ